MSKCEKSVHSSRPQQRAAHRGHRCQKFTHASPHIHMQWQLRVLEYGRQIRKRDREHVSGRKRIRMLPMPCDALAFRLAFRLGRLRVTGFAHGRGIVRRRCGTVGSHLPPLAPTLCFKHYTPTSASPRYVASTERAVELWNARANRHSRAKGVRNAGHTRQPTSEWRTSQHANRHSNRHTNSMSARPQGTQTHRQQAARNSSRAEQAQSFLADTAPYFLMIR